MPGTHLPRELPQADPGPHRSQRAELQSALTDARAAHERGDLRAAAEAYRRILFVLPAQPSALLGLSLIARQTNQLTAALNMAGAAVAAGPRIAAAWCNLGEILLASSQSTSLPDQGDAKGKRAIAAQRALEQALAIDPTLTAAQMGLGNAAAHREDYLAAFAHFTHADELAPGRAAASFALGFTCSKLGRHREAIEHYRAALLLNPAFASAWLNLGVELVADGRDQLAPPCYAQAIQCVRKLAAQPNSDPLATELSAQLNLGHLARSRQRYLSAQGAYQQALRLADAHPHRLREVHLAFTSLELDQQHFPQAWISLRRAEQLPGSLSDAETCNTRGILLLAEHAAGAQPTQAALIDEAIGAFSAAEALGHKTAASNYANALLRLGRVKEALAAHENALRLDPMHPGVRYNLALTQLRSGNFAEGWANYEIRWDFREIHPRPRRFAQPRWFGGPLLGHDQPATAPLGLSETGLQSPEFSSEFPHHSGLWNPESTSLFLYAEQGLGDTLQFLRYLPLVAARLPGVSIVLEVQPPVERVIAEALKPDSGTCLAGLPVHLIAAGTALPEFTHHCPLMSLPALFATTLETVPTSIPYLRAPQASHALEQPAEITKPRPFSIGIHWAGNPRYRADRERSTMLAVFEPLLRVPGIRWVSLQKGPAARQIDQLPHGLRPIDAASSDQDLADTANTIAALDLVITTDSAVAHLTGALGKPLWLLLPWQSDWRWMQEIETTPWYRQARLWRQSSSGDWTGLIERVRAELLDRLGDRCDTTEAVEVP